MSMMFLRFSFMSLKYSSWHDGKYWNVVIDTSEEGDLGKIGVPKLRPYSETYDYATLTEQDKLNVSVNIFEKVSTGKNVLRK